MKAIDLHEFRRLRLEDFAMVIDVLPRDLYAQHHVPGAHNIPVDAADFDERIRRAVPDPDTNIVVYCHGRDCDESRRAAYRIEGLGYRKVHEFEDGIECWKEAGYTLAMEPYALTT